MGKKIRGVNKRVSRLHRYCDFGQIAALAVCIDARTRLMRLGCMRELLPLPPTTDCSFTYAYEQVLGARRKLGLLLTVWNSEVVESRLGHVEKI